MYSEQPCMQYKEEMIVAVIMFWKETIGKRFYSFLIEHISYVDSASFSFYDLF